MDSGTDFPIHGGEVWRLSRLKGIDPASILDMSANLNDFINPADFGCVNNSQEVANYPETDLEPYDSRIAAYSMVERENVMLGPGLTYFIYRMAERFRGMRVLLMNPSFGEYMRAFRVNSCAVVTFNSPELNEMMGRISSGGYDLVVLTRPDNPVGELIPRDSLIELAEACQKGDAHLFIDEAFIDFLGQQEMMESASLVKKYRNIILGRSLTKIFSIPSMRIGYIISSPDLIREFKTSLEPWTIGQMGLNFILKADFDSLSSTALEVSREREFLIESMKSRGFRLIGNPTANFASFYLPQDYEMESFLEHLADCNILVRPLPDHPELGPNCIRVAVKKRESTKRFIDSIDSFENNKELRNSQALE